MSGQQEVRGAVPLPTPRMMWKDGKARINNKPHRQILHIVLL